MKITVAKKDLETSLKVALTTISGSGVDDLEGHFVFVKVGDKVEIRTFNQRIFSSTPIPACIIEEDENASFTIEGKRLRMWLGAVDDAALKFNFDGVVTRASSPRGRASFQSLDPNGFPKWEKRFKDAEKTSTVPAHKLRAALNYARLFVSDNETQNPGLCVVEFRDGEILSTDQIGLSKIEMEQTKDCGIRIHGKDIPSVMSFLGFFGEDNIDIYEHKKLMFFVAPDGSIFGESRPGSKFPKGKLGEGLGKIWWDFPKQDLQKAVKILCASAAWEDHRLTLKRTGEEIEASMMSSANEKVSFLLPCLDHDGGEDSTINEISLSYKYLQKVLANYEADVIRMGMRKGEKFGGWSVFEEDRLESHYLTILCWLA